MGLLEYLCVIGAVLALAVYEFLSVSRALRRTRRIRNGKSERTQGD
jgi:hypothetical protein